MIDERLKELLTKYGEADKESVWKHSRGNKSIWIATHAACERMASKAGVTFEGPQLLFCDATGSCVALLVTGRDKEGNEEWSVGEASQQNCKNSYPWAMAEKRGKDRVILKLLGLHGMLYSDVEADDFSEAEKKTLSDSLYTPATQRKNSRNIAESGLSQRQQNLSK